MEAKRPQEDSRPRPAAQRARRVRSSAPARVLDLTRKLRDENQRLKKLVAEQRREIRWLRYVAKLE
jgi:hypothetical protein